MTEAVAGPVNAAAVGTALDGARQPRDPALARQGTDAGTDSGPAQGQPAPAPGASVKLAAELLRLQVGTLLGAVAGPPDAEGRPTLTTAAGQFALLAPPMPELRPGMPLSIEVKGAADNLSVVLRTSAEGIPRSAELLFLGAAGTAAAQPSRQLFAGVLVPADDRPVQTIAVHLAAADAGLAATVTARRIEADGTVLLRLASAEGTVTLSDAPADLAVGARVALEIIARNAPRLPAAPLSPATLPSLAGASPAILQFAAGRTVLADVEALLAKARPDGALSLAQILPGLGQRDGQMPALALLSAAMKFRDTRRLLGEERREIIEGKAGPAPLLRAGAELGEIARAAAEPTAQGWRPVVLPFFDGREIVPVMIFVRPQEEQPPEDEDAAEPRGRRRRGARFMVDLSLSELGSLQIDGFLREGRLDTVLRSRRPLDDGLCRDLEARYLAVVEASGLAGSLAFQVQDGLPVIQGIGAAAPIPAGHISVTA